MKTEDFISSARLKIHRQNDRKKCRFSPLFQTQKWSTVTACVVVAVLPIFYALILFYPGRKEWMDVRSRRRCGNVYNWLYHGTVGNGVCRMWESPGFSMYCECVFHRCNGLLCTFPRCRIIRYYRYPHHLLPQSEQGQPL